MNEQQENDDSSSIIRVLDKKSSLMQQSLQLVFATFCIILLFFYSNGLSIIKTNQIQTLSAAQLPKTNKQILGFSAQKESQAFPVRLKIPKINVDAAIKSVGITPKGEMEVPNNIVDVAWFALGPRPGERGSAVIAGHLVGDNSEAGVFVNLYKLNAGDKLYVKDDKGKSIIFTVRGSHVYDPGYADDVFSSSDSAHLNLITCDGIWDGAKKSYTKRLVVFADITE
jgi:LPXTG-site transpeptidase (sortase) family protein